MLKKLKILGESGLDWVNDGGIYYPYLSEGLVKVMVESGCYRIFLPVESPSFRTMHKHYKYNELKSENTAREKLEEATKYLNKYGLEFYSAIMIGFPGEYKEDLVKAIEYVKFLKN